MATRGKSLELEGQPIPHTHHLPKALIGTAALIALLGGYALTRGGETNSPVIDNNPVSDSLKPPEPPQLPEIPVVVPPPSDTAPAPTKLEPPPPELKPLPDVINSQTVKFVSLPDNEVQNMINEAKRKGELKIALPEELANNPSLSLVEIQNGRGNVGFAITASISGKYRIQAPLGGKVSELVKGMPTVIGFSTGDSNETLLGFVAPDEPNIRLLTERGHDVQVGTDVIEISYDPNSWGSFLKNLRTQFRNVPDNVIALIGGKTGTNLTRDQILRIAQEVVVVGTSGKG